MGDGRYSERRRRYGTIEVDKRVMQRGRGKMGRGDTERMRDAERGKGDTTKEGRYRATEVEMDTEKERGKI